MRLNYYPSLLAVALSTLSLISSCQTLRLPTANDDALHHHNQNAARLERRGTPRSIVWGADLAMKEPKFSQKLGRYVYAASSFVEFGATDTEPALRVGITTEYGRLGGTERTFALRAVDFGGIVADSHTAPTEKHGRRVVRLDGTTSLTNAQIASRTTGKGLLLKLWVTDPVYRTGPAANAEEVNPYNGCNTFLRKLLLHPDVLGPTFALPPLIDQTLEESWENVQQAYDHQIRVTIREIHYETFLYVGWRIIKLRRTFSFDPHYPQLTTLVGETNPATGTFQLEQGGPSGACLGSGLVRSGSGRRKRGESPWPLLAGC